MSSQNKFLYADMFGDGPEQQHKRETAIYIYIYFFFVACKWEAWTSLHVDPCSTAGCC